ncbi:hypothetical protein [Pseudoroseomonas cervicalis]|uniref:hypothetical protein n=1 Tax=Teichococcus cervicalis TaxID=204525 RepID=UPI0027814BE7|nr:hypothetical protein [Pseudoroseomonas cervicalis]MDQ1081449.1 hypothetical protein [Pseudoroseomonas cervicalis]
MSGTRFERDISLWLDRNLSDRALSKRLAAYARRRLDETIASGQGSRAYKRYVDGVLGASEDQVRPDGRIVYEFTYLADATVFALGYLMQRSPVKSGRFRSSFYLGISRGQGGRAQREVTGGRFIPAATFNPQTMSADAFEVVIGNTQPYSRKVDVQLVGLRRLRFEVPAGMFEDAARAVNGQFGNSVRARRVYTMRFPGQYRLQQPQYRKDAPHRIKRGVGDFVESPALIISIL